MVNKTTTLDTLQAELKECLARYTSDPDGVLAEIWPHVVEALDFAEFVEQSKSSSAREAVIEDPLAHMSEEEREAFIAQKRAEMDPAIREGLEKSRGKWLRDEQS